MSKGSGKFIQLEWECPQCDGRNPGPEQSCLSCGAPQPDDVEFVAPAERKYVSDEKSLKAARSGADTHCGFCDTRNPGNAEICSQCGGDLAEGERRKAGGEVRQRAAEQKIRCSNCDAENTSSNHTCAECGAPLAQQKLASAQSDAKGIKASGGAKEKASPKKRGCIIGAVLAVIALCVAGAVFLFAPSESVAGTVSDVHWQTSIAVQEQQEVRHDNETGSVPSDAYDVSCHTESEQVCTTELVDQGNGFAEEVESCDTQNEEYCSYTALEWQTIETFTMDGNDYNPSYASPSLSNEQRLGNEDIDYSVNFSTEKGNIDYAPDDLDEYRQFQLGSSWNLNLNRLGTVVSVER